jgi:hypothetical protein
MTRPKRCACGRPTQAKGLCNACYLKRWRKNNPERSRAINIRYRKKNKQAILRWNRQYNKKYYEENREVIFFRTIKRKYKISREEYEALLIQQDGRCAICRRKPSPGKRLGVDHCHKKLKIRKLLCTNCNAGLGNFKDSLKLLRLAIEYLMLYKE